MISLPTWLVVTVVAVLLSGIALLCLILFAVAEVASGFLGIFGIPTKKRR